jgi:hypothetical protein
MVNFGKKVIGKILGDRKSKNFRNEDVIGYTKNGSKVTFESTSGYRGNTFFVHKDNNSGGKIIKEENLEKNVVTKTNPDFWKKQKR